MRPREPRDVRGKPWLAAALLGIALLILPALALIIVPRAGHFVAPRPPRQSVRGPSLPSDPEGEVAEDDDVQDGAARPVDDAGESADEQAISGSVVDPDGKPVDDALVRCVEHPGDVAISKGGGRFKLRLAADGCKVIAMHAEFAPSREQRLDVGRPNELRLRAGGSIEGVVVDERGSGVTPVMVAVESFHAVGGVSDDLLTPPPPSTRAKSFDARDGSFSLGKLPPGKYVLTASAERRPPAHSEAIDVEAGRVARGVKIVLPRGGRLNGRVVDRATRRAIAGVRVSLDRTSGGEISKVGDVTTDDRGRFTLEGAPLGPFSLRFAHADYKTRVVSSLTTPPGGTAPDIEIDLGQRGDGGAESEMSGIGAQIAPSAGVVRVVSLLPNSPAGRAGLRAEDEIVKIDGADVGSFSIDESMQRLRGAAGTKVVVVARRGNDLVEVTIVRGELAGGR